MRTAWCAKVHLIVQLLCRERGCMARLFVKAAAAAAATAAAGGGSSSSSTDKSHCRGLQDTGRSISSCCCPESGAASTRLPAAFLPSWPQIDPALRCVGADPPFRYRVTITDIPCAPKQVGVSVARGGWLDSQLTQAGTDGPALRSRKVITELGALGWQ